MAHKRFALLSVANKKGIETFARGLVDLGFTLLSTGGTAAAIGEAGLPVTRVEQYIGGPEILGGKIKTIHPRIHAGIIAKEDGGEIKVLEKLHAEPIDLVAVNFRPFEYVVATPDISIEDSLEIFDLGGPALLRSAVRNLDRVTAVSSPDDYETVLWHIAKNNDVPKGVRLGLAMKALEHTTAYDKSVLGALGKFDPETGRLKK